MDGPTTAAVAGLASATAVALNKLLEYFARRRAAAAKQRQAISQTALSEREELSREQREFRQELRNELTRLYLRVDELERDGELKAERISDLEQQIDAQGRTIHSHEAYISVLTGVLRIGGYEIPPRPEVT